MRRRAALPLPAKLSLGNAKLSSEPLGTGIFALLPFPSSLYPFSLHAFFFAPHLTIAML